MPTLWVAELFVSDRTAEKLIAKHGLDPDDIRSAVVGIAGLRFTWQDHPDRGRRAILETTIGDDVVLVVLYPADSPIGDAWHLGSAYRITSRRGHR